MNADAKRYYAILGVDPKCSDEDIRHAFRRRAKELHPDAETGNASDFIRLKKAYDTLGQPASRARYDGDRLSRLRRQTLAEEPPPRPPRAPRPGGISFARYAVAFLFMAGLSYGAIEVMISLADVPAGSTLRPAGPSLTGPHPVAKSEDRDAAKETGTGFWDSSSPDGTPREPAEPPGKRRPSPSSADGPAALPGR